MASAFISSPAEIVVIDSRTRPGTITLPLTNSIPYRVVSFKDQYGSFANSTLTLSTQTGETFDDGTTSKTFSNAFGYVSLYATPSRWMIMNATTTQQQTISSLTVNQLTFGTGAGWVQFGPVQASIVSTIQVNTNDAYINNVFVGNQSTLNDIMFWGLFGNYNNTVLAEISTGAGTQEFLVFKGSSASDRVRVQTTGNFVVETGVSSRLFNSNTIPTQSNATPAFIVNTSSNVGIQTATPQTALDVAGTVRGQTVSTLALNLSSLNGGTLLTPAQLISTTTGLVEVPELISSIVGLGSVGYVSSASLLNLVSTSFLNTTLASSITGLGSAGYISSTQLISTTAGLIEVPELVSSIVGLGSAGYVSSASLSGLVSTTFLNTTLASSFTGLGSAGYVSTASLLNLVSTPNLLNLVSTQGLSTVLYSTINSLGSFGYISTSQLVSTVAGLGTGGYPSTVSTAYGTNFITSNLTASTISFVNVNPSAQNLWVTTGTSGTGVYFKYSRNGINWSDGTGTFSAFGRGIGWNGRIWVASGINGGQAGSIKYSGDGINWSNSATGGFSNDGGGFAWNGRNWIAVGYNGSAISNVQTSTDGINWTGVGNGITTTTGVSAVAWNGTIWLVAGYNNSGLQYSGDGYNWSNITSGGFGIYGQGVAWNGRMWVAVGYDNTPAGSIQYSYDALNWTRAASGLFTTMGLCVAWNGRMWVAGGTQASGSLGTLKYSYDGINWSNGVNSKFNNGGGLGVTWNGSLWVATGQSSSGFTIHYSSDGVNWSDGTNVYGAGGLGAAVAFSSNLTPAYQQSNLSILPQNIPLFLTSTNSILVQPSSLLINNTLLIDTIFDRVGINNNIPQADLDVGGTVRAVTISSQQLFVSTLNGAPVIGSTQFISTVIGLGSAGYISTSQLVSTVAGIASGNVTTNNLTSTVAGLGSAGYISSINLQNLVSTTFLNTSLASTVTGLGSAGYISSTQLISTTAGLVEHSELVSSITGLGSLGYLSSITYPANFSTSALFVSSISTTFIQTVVLSSVAIFASSIVAPYIFQPQFFTF